MKLQSTIVAGPMEDEMRARNSWCRMFQPLICCFLAFMLVFPPSIRAEKVPSAVKFAERVRDRGVASNVWVKLTSGRAYEGFPRASDEETLTLVLHSTGEPVSIAFSEIAQFKADKHVKVKLNDERVIKGSIGKISEENFVLLERTTGQPVSIAYEDVAQFSKPLAAGWKVLIVGGAVIGGALVPTLLGYER